MWSNQKARGSVQRAASSGQPSSHLDERFNRLEAHLNKRLDEFLNRAQKSLLAFQIQPASDRKPSAYTRISAFAKTNMAWKTGKPATCLTETISRLNGMEGSPGNPATAPPHRLKGKDSKIR